MTDEVIQVKVTPVLKVVMAALVLFALATSWFVVRWYLGNTIAENLPPDQSQLATAELAVRMAPQDPLPHWRLGNLISTELHSDQIPRVVAEYEKAVSLAPNDYRFWMDLGGALEQAGDTANAEKAMRTAVKLAPAYAFPRWHLGNLLLRIGQFDNGFAELRRAGEANDQLQPQLFNLAWQVNRDDFAALNAAVGNVPGTRAEFAKYLAARGKFEDALRVWNSLSAEEKKNNRSAADSMVASLAKEKRYTQALQLWNDVAPAESVKTQLGQFTDPGFEGGVINTPGVIFGWQLPSIAQVQISVDPSQGHSGSRSLKLVFQVRESLEAINVTQLIPVEPNTEYDFECYYKTEKLTSISTPFIAFEDASDGSRVATSEPAPNGESDWQRLSVSFKTGPKTEGIKLIINRAKCDSDIPVCPIFGTLWYDDFNLKTRK